MVSHLIPDQEFSVQFRVTPLRYDNSLSINKLILIDNIKLLA